MERIINGRADMEAFAKELRLGEVDKYRVKFEKTGVYYKIDKDKFESYLSGGSDRKFYEEVGLECDFIANPYYKGKPVVANDLDDLDDLDAGEQAPVEVEAVEEVVAEENAYVAEEVVEQAACDCEAKDAKIAELNAQVDTLTAEKVDLEARHNELQESYARTFEELAEKQGEIESLTALIGTITEEKAEIEAKLQAPVNMADFSLDVLVKEIASRGYAVELKFSSK